MAAGNTQHICTPMSTCGISSDDKMSTVKGELVWVGFIDVLPVIGSIKEAVEFVLAVAGGDPLLAKEKERMMKVRLGLGEKIKSGRSTASSSGYCSREEKEAVSVKAVVLSDLPGVIQAGTHDKGKQSGKQSQQPPSAKDQKKMTIQKETLQKIQRINQNYKFQEPLVDTGKRSRRGEHVINNNVIKFHFKLVEDYLKGRSGQTGLDVSCPLTGDTQNAIMSEMVAYFEADELYINANALVYSIYISELREALLQFLQDGSQEWKDRASFVIFNMNQSDAYVDDLAKEKWIQNSSRKLQRFNAARKEVAEMFADTRGTEFFAELRKDILSHTGNV